MTLLSNNTLFDLNTLLSGAYSPHPLSTRRGQRKAPLSSVANETKPTYSPAVDIIKQKDHYLLVAEIPGISKEQISVSVDNSTLTIETKPDNTQTKKEDIHYLRRERTLGTFHRSFELSQGIEQSDITATFKDGLLSLKIPIQKEEKTARRIDIH